MHAYRSKDFLLPTRERLARVSSHLDQSFLAENSGDEEYLNAYMMVEI